MSTARAGALALKLALELCMLAALAYWGAQAGGSTAVDVLLAVAAVALVAAGAPVLAAVFAALVALDSALLLRWEAQERTGPGARAD